MDDPWRHVADLDGRQHYRTLGIRSDATVAEIRRAYRALARKLHPDKGGDSESFARLRHAFDVLTDPSRRAVYDRWAGDIRYRYIPGVTRRFPGGEEELFKRFERSGIHCDPATQLIVTCEVCGRPSTKQCWTCQMHICDFCTLKQHWKDAHPLHWPLVDSKAFRTRLAKAEMEKKVQEDAESYYLQDPNYRSQHDLQTIRSFKCAAAEVEQRHDATRHYDGRLARFYMWAQTPKYVILAVHVPTGYADRSMKIEYDSRRLLIQSEGSFPVIHRQLSLPFADAEIDVYATTDNRYHTIFLKKRQSDDVFKHLFVGDSDGVRCLEPPYTLYDVDDEVVLDLPVPFWIDADDIDVQFTEKDVNIHVRNQFAIRRRYWTELDTVATQRKETTPAVNVSQCSWCLEDETVINGERAKTLSISFVRPPPTDAELKWKRGIRQDNKTQQLPHRHSRGMRFFADDEDEFRLEDILQAACLKVSSQTFVPSKPWEKKAAYRTTRLVDLCLEAQILHQQLFVNSSGKAAFL